MEVLQSDASAVNRTSSITGESDTVTRLSEILRSSDVSDFEFKRVPQDYYDQPLEYRWDVLGAASVDHLCKSIVLVNTQAASDVTDCSDRKNSKYYVVIVQYTARFNNEAVRKYLYELNEGKIAKKRFNFLIYVSYSPEEAYVFWKLRSQLLLRLAPEDVSAKLTGYEHNGVTCVGMKTDIPIIVDEAITKLNPEYFWLGGGEVDLKLGIRTSEFIKFAKPFIINCSGT